MIYLHTNTIPMEDITEVTAVTNVSEQEVQTCQYCSNEVTDKATFCGRCGNPINGTAEEKDKFDLEYKTKRAELEGMQEATQSATKTLYILSGLIALSNTIFFAVSDNKAYIIAALILCPIFAGLGWWSKTKPFTALLIALILYATVILADAFADPTTLAKGIIVKILIVAYLGKGIKAAYAAQNMKKQLADKNWI